MGPASHNINCARLVIILIAILTRALKAVTQFMYQRLPG